MEKRKTGIKNIAPYAYITPITLILVTFVIGSVIISVVLGFTKYNIMTEPVFSGLDNYRRLLTDSKFIKYAGTDRHHCSAADRVGHLGIFLSGGQP